MTTMNLDCFGARDDAGLTIQSSTTRVTRRILSQTKKIAAKVAGSLKNRCERLASARLLHPKQVQVAAHSKTTEGENTEAESTSRMSPDPRPLDHVHVRLIANIAQHEKQFGQVKFKKARRPGFLPELAMILEGVSSSFEKEPEALKSPIPTGGTYPPEKANISDMTAGVTFTMLYGSISDSDSSSWTSSEASDSDSNSWKSSDAFESSDEEASDLES